MKPVITPSGEDYLEAILVLHKKMGMVRSVDVALSLIHISSRHLIKVPLLMGNIQMLSMKTQTISTNG